MTKSTAFDVVVVGSANLDLAVGVSAVPVAGETVLGGDLVEGPGGKGLNQAVAAARLGRRTAFVGAVGRDPAGDGLLRLLAEEGVHPRVARSVRPTGRALVLTDASGDSTIVVSPGANATVDAAMVGGAAELVSRTGAVLVQHEVPPAAVEAAARVAGLAGALFVLNPAPGRVVSRQVLARVDVLVPNRHELAVLAGRTVPRSPGGAAAAASRLGLEATVVVTLGADGAVVVRGETWRHVPAVATPVVDATGAGDTFCAALVDGLLAGAGAVEATRWAARAAAVTVARAGAAVSLPRRPEIG